MLFSGHSLELLLHTTLSEYNVSLFMCVYNFVRLRLINVWQSTFYYFLLHGLYIVSYVGLFCKSLFRLDQHFVESLSTFNISCSLSDSLLSCTSDYTTLPGRTLCQFDSQTPVNCELYLHQIQVFPYNNSASIFCMNLCVL